VSVATDRPRYGSRVSLAGVRFDDAAAAVRAADAALQAEPSIGLLLPCNVVVRATDDATTVEAVDPDVLVRWAGNEALAPVARDVGERLKAALDVVRSWGEAR
jgi:hypothetical protein